MIRRRGKKFQLVSSGGRVMGSHSSRAGAVRQEREVRVSKARRAGHRIPRRR